MGPPTFEAELAKVKKDELADFKGNVEAEMNEVRASHSRKCENGANKV